MIIQYAVSTVVYEGTDHPEKLSVDDLLTPNHHKFQKIWDPYSWTQEMSMWKIVIEFDSCSLNSMYV